MIIIGSLFDSLVQIILIFKSTPVGINEKGFVNSNFGGIYMASNIACICEYHIKSAYFREKSFKLAKSRHFGDSKMVRQVYITFKEISVR